MRSLFIEDMNWVDIEYQIKNGYRNVIVGLASIEQHGPHLPLKTDVLLLEVIITKVAAKLGRTLVAPTIKTGCSEKHLSFAGTITLGKLTLQSIIQDYIFSLTKHGFENIIFLPSQKENSIALIESITKLNERSNKNNVISLPEFEDILQRQLRISFSEKITKEEAGFHAGEIETSMLLNIFPAIVKTNRFKSGFIDEMSEEERVDAKTRGIKSITENGIVGDPAKSTSRRGELYINAAVDVVIDGILRYLK